MFHSSKNLRSENQKKAQGSKAKGLVRPSKKSGHYYFNGTPCDAYTTISNAKYGTMLNKNILEFKNTIPA